MRASKEGGDVASFAGGESSGTAAAFPFPLASCGHRWGGGGGGLYLVGGLGMVAALRYHHVASRMSVIHPEVWW